MKLKTLSKKIKQYSTELSQSIIKMSEINTYKIKAGDNFSKLSDGDPQFLKLILEANPDVDPAKLQIGQEIIIPPKPRRPNKLLNPSEHVISFLKKYEGKNGQPILSPYDDGFGNITVGWGHNLGKNVSTMSKINLQEAESLFQKDLEHAANFVRNNVSVELTQGRFDALTSLVFNAGVGAVFKSNLFKLIEQGKFITALNEFPSTLIGKNQGGLVERRLEETKMFAS